MTPRNVAVAAEAFAAAQFARLGFDVSVQYGANQPEYDLLSAKMNVFCVSRLKAARWWLGFNAVVYGKESRRNQRKLPGCNDCLGRKTPSANSFLPYPILERECDRTTQNVSCKR